MTKRQNGFTIVELLLGGTLIILITGALVVLATLYFQNFSFSFEETLSISYAQNAMTTMVREIREARYGEDGAWPLAQADDTTLTFYSDVTNDNKSDKVRYFLDGSDLKKGVTESSVNPIEYNPANEIVSVVASPVSTASGSIFTYYNGDWPSDTVNNPLAAGSRLLNTRYIDIHLLIDINPNQGALPFELNSGVQVRGLKDNL